MYIRWLGLSIELQCAMDGMDAKLIKICWNCIIMSSDESRIWQHSMKTAVWKRNVVRQMQFYKGNFIRTCIKGFAVCRARHESMKVSITLWIIIYREAYSTVVETINTTSSHIVIYFQQNRWYFSVHLYWNWGQSQTRLNTRRDRSWWLPYWWGWSYSWHLCQPFFLAVHIEKGHR
jgi:hypothetical protein